MQFEYGNAQILHRRELHLSLGADLMKVWFEGRFDLIIVDA